MLVCVKIHRKFYQVKIKLYLAITNPTGNSSTYKLFLFILASLISFSLIVLIIERIRNSRKSGWVTTEVKKNVQVEYEILNEINESPLITDL